jgi:hypothetical protein
VWILCAGRVCSAKQWDTTTVLRIFARPERKEGKALLAQARAEGLRITGA